MRKRLWSPDEDEKLQKYVSQHGFGNWSEVAKKTGLQRCGKSCRLRWINYLRPDLKRGKLSAEEKMIIVNLQKVFGNSWSKIAAHLPGRTDSDIKNFWHSHFRKMRPRHAGANHLFNPLSSSSSTSAVAAMASSMSSANPSLQMISPSPFSILNSNHINQHHPSNSAAANSGTAAFHHLAAAVAASADHQYNHHSHHQHQHLAAAAVALAATSNNTSFSAASVISTTLPGFHFPANPNAAPFLNNPNHGAVSAVNHQKANIKPEGGSSFSMANLLQKSTISMPCLEEELINTTHNYTNCIKPADTRTNNLLISADSAGASAWFNYNSTAAAEIKLEYLNQSSESTSTGQVNHMINGDNHTINHMINHNHGHINANTITNRHNHVGHTMINNSADDGLVGINQGQLQLHQSKVMEEEPVEAEDHNYEEGPPPDSPPEGLELVVWSCVNNNNSNANPNNNHPAGSSSPPSNLTSDQENLINIMNPCSSGNMSPSNSDQIHFISMHSGNTLHDHHFI